MSVKQTFRILGFGLDEESGLILKARLHHKSSRRTNSRSISRRQKIRPECLQVLPASRVARFGRRVSDSVVASKVWGCVGACQILFCFLRVRRVVACVAGGSFRASRLGLRRCF